MDSEAAARAYALEAQRSLWSELLLERIARPAEDSNAMTPAGAAADSRKAQQAA